MIGRVGGEKNLAEAKLSPIFSVYVIRELLNKAKNRRQYISLTVTFLPTVLEGFHHKSQIH